MKTLVIAFIFVTCAVHAQNFAIDWFTIDGGGGTSTGGVYSISGTIGQPDAGPVLTGGNYSLVGGFNRWNDAVLARRALTLNGPTAGDTTRAHYEDFYERRHFFPWMTPPPPRFDVHPM